MKLAIFGTSGFSREVRDIAAITGYDEIFFLGETGEETVPDGTVLAESAADSLAQAGFRFAIGIGSPEIRRKIYNRYPDLDYPNLIHPTATFGFQQLEEVQKRAGNIICAGVRFTNQIGLGSFCILNLNCMVGHDCVIGDFVTVSPGANVSGNVKIGEGAYIGANSCIIQGKSVSEKIEIGRGSTVGAGAVVTKSVAADIIVKGVPAR
jgi:sugar O-acyltransferase (sialic acid O-acetyltransferase NeuD family)